jgi:hypothetical protein
MQRNRGRKPAETLLQEIVATTKSQFQHWQSIMGRSDKKPKFGTKPHPIKAARWSEDQSDYRRNVVLLFFCFDNAKNWTTDSRACNCDALALLGHFRSLESRTWQDIKLNDRRDHPIKIVSLESNAQRRLEELKMDDIDELWSFRFGSTLRIWGYKLSHELRVLWLDPDHQVYKVDVQEKGKSKRRQ